jgi:hypothetical protein
MGCSVMRNLTDRGCHLGGNVSRAACANLPCSGQYACAYSVILRARACALRLKEADPLHQLGPVVLHIADLGADFQGFDRRWLWLLSTSQHR